MGDKIRMEADKVRENYPDVAKVLDAIAVCVDDGTSLDTCIDILQKVYAQKVS